MSQRFRMNYSPTTAIENDNVKQISLKQFSSLSTLTYHNMTPSPQLINTPKINLSKFSSINITDKVKEKLHNNHIKLLKTQRKKRNLSMGSVLMKEYVNPQFVCNSSRDIVDSSNLGNNGDDDDKMNFLNVNLKEFQSKNVNKLSIGSKHRNLELSLPVIDIKKKYKKTSPIKANFMQLWLDQALDPQQLNTQQMKDVQNQLHQQNQSNSNKVNQQINHSIGGSSYLSTVRQYKIDKQYLKSQNIPQQVIDRLYNTLYIYTYGIDKVFEQILSVVKNSNNNSIDSQKQHNNKLNNSNKLLDIFWRSYIKLLQSSTSFQTTFQHIQQQHIHKINQLKQSIIKRQNGFQQQRYKLNQNIHKLQKQLLLKQSKYNKLQSEYKISQATLQLTDHTLNEQVQLRLKFQQKINHIYSSYQQLKVKYQSTVEQLNLKIQQQINNKYQQQSSKQHIRKLQSQLQETKHLLQQQTQKVKQRQQQIIIKKQQFNDLQAVLHQKEAKENIQEDHINIQMGQNKLLQVKYQQQKKKSGLIQYKWQKSQQKVKQLSQVIEIKRIQYDELLIKFNQKMKQLAEYQHTKITQYAQINTLTHQLQLTKQKLSLQQQQTITLQNKLQHTQTQLQQSNYQIQTKHQAMSKINNTIEDLKSIKNKYQRLFKIINQEKKKLQQEKNKIQQKYQLEKQQIQGMRMLQQNRQKHIKEIQNKHDKQKDILKRKITGYNQIVTKKQSLILQYQKNQEQQNNVILDLKYRLENVQKEMIDNNSKMSVLEKEKLFVQGRLIDAKQQVDRLNKQMQRQNNKMYENMKVLDIREQQLGSLKSLLQMIKSQQSMAVNNIKSLYNEYKLTINRKGQHIHPMLFEDICQQFNRLKLQAIPNLEKEIVQRKQCQQRLNKDIESRDNTIDQLNIKIRELLQKLKQKQQQIHKYKQQQTQLQHKINKLASTINNNEQLITTLNHTITQHQSVISQLNQQIKLKNNLSQQLSKKLSIKQLQQQKLNLNINILSDKLLIVENQINNKQKNHIHLEKIKQLEKQVDRLTLQLNKYISKTYQQRDMQTQPQGQVIIQKKINNNNNTFSRKNKFTTNLQLSTTNNKQTQVSLPPYDNIPLYIDNKITQIQLQNNNNINNNNISVNNNNINNSSNSKQVSGVGDRKQQRQMPSTILLNSNKSQSLVKDNNKSIISSIEKMTIQVSKQPITRRQQLRRALRVTYMRR